MWRLMMFVMCLIATLSGTPLRQAEAAGDFARFVADLEGCPDIDDIDGGVGDDSGATILNARSDSQSLQPMMTLPLTDSVQLLLRVKSPTGTTSQLATDRVAMLSVGSVQKHAWLECFLF
jgi:hypothetical protein